MYARFTILVLFAALGAPVSNHAHADGRGRLTRSSQPVHGVLKTSTNSNRAGAHARPAKGLVRRFRAFRERRQQEGREYRPSKGESLESMAHSMLGRANKHLKVMVARRGGYYYLGGPGDGYLVRTPVSQSGPIIYKPSRSSTASVHGTNMVALANVTGERVIGRFLGTRLEVLPGMKASEAMQPFTRRSRKKKSQAMADREALIAKFGGRKGRPRGFEEAPGAYKAGSYGGEGTIRVTSAQLLSLSKGTVLQTVFGSERIVGVDKIRGEVHNGFLDVGFPSRTP